jgi:hypothetical protein
MTSVALAPRVHLVDPVDDIPLFLVCQDLVASGKERLACFRNTIVKFKRLLELYDVADRGIGHVEKFQTVQGNFGNFLAKISDLLILPSPPPKV